MPSCSQSELVLAEPQTVAGLLKVRVGGEAAGARKTLETFFQMFFTGSTMGALRDKAWGITQLITR